MHEIQLQVADASATSTRDNEANTIPLVNRLKDPKSSRETLPTIETRENSRHVDRETNLEGSHPHSSALPNHGGKASTAAASQGTSSRPRCRSPFEGASQQVPGDWENLNELEPIAPTERASYSRGHLETLHSPDLERNNSNNARFDEEEAPSRGQGMEQPISWVATQLYTISYLIFFSILGTLARLGLTALTTYPGTPITFTTIWANMGGSFIMGFLIEDGSLFRQEWGARDHQMDQRKDTFQPPDDSTRDAAKKAHLAVKKTVPLYIGLTTGFCGSMTSFSTFIRDVFLALSNDAAIPGASDLPVSRNGGYSFMAMLAVIVSTTALSFAGFLAGTHLATAAEPFTPSLPFRITRKVVDPIIVFLGLGSWLGAVLLSILPPHDFWRQRATFALVFAPLGCILRFYLAIILNGKKPSFPLGTFAANLLGTALLGMAWDIAHVQVGGIVGCQVLQGIEDGFCGCLTTVSTWVAELTSLRKKHAYLYGVASVLVAFALLVMIMGGLRWSHGFEALLC